LGCLKTVNRKGREERIIYQEEQGRGGEKKGMKTLSRKEREECAKDARKEFLPCRERAAWQKSHGLAAGFLLVVALCSW